MHILDNKFVPVQKLLVSAFGTWTLRFSVLFHLHAMASTGRMPLADASMDWDTWLIVNVSTDLLLQLSDSSIVVASRPPFGADGDYSLPPAILAIFEEPACLANSGVTRDQGL